MKLIEANRIFRLVHEGMADQSEAFYALSQILHINSSPLMRLLDRSGIKRKMLEIDENAHRVSIFEFGGEIMSSVDNHRVNKVIFLSLDELMLLVLGINKNGFFYVFRAILSDEEMFGLLTIGNELRIHESLMRSKNGKG